MVPLEFLELVKQRVGVPLRVQGNFRSRSSHGQGSQAKTCGWKLGGSGACLSSRRCQRRGEEERRGKGKGKGVMLSMLHVEWVAA